MAIGIVTCVLAYGASVALRHSEDTAPSSVDAVLEVPEVPASVGRVLAMGFQSVVADLHYLQAIQAFGERYLRAARIADKQRHSLVVYRLLDYATELDPRFNYAYVFGANSIPIPTMDGTLLNLDETVALLRKGAANGGSDWRIPFYLAYLLATYTGDLAGAAQYMAEAGRRPKCPKYVPLLATRLAAAGGSIETGIALAKARAEQAETPEEREQFDERIRLLQMERDIRFLEDALNAYHQHNGRWPQRLEDLVTDHAIDQLPPEPHGGTYRLDLATGDVTSSAAARLRLPDTVQEEMRQNWKAHEKVKEAHP
jgi:hypothetical protein